MRRAALWMEGPSVHPIFLFRDGQLATFTSLLEYSQLSVACLITELGFLEWDRHRWTQSAQ